MQSVYEYVLGSHQRSCIVCTSSQIGQYAAPEQRISEVVRPGSPFVIGVLQLVGARGSCILEGVVDAQAKRALKH